MYTLKENQVHFDQQPFLSWTGYSTKSFAFFGPPNIPGTIALPPNIPSQIKLPSLTEERIHRIQGFATDEPSVIRLDGPGANIHIQFAQESTANITYQGKEGPRALFTWQTRGNASVPVLQFDGEIQSMYPISTEPPSLFQNKTKVRYGMYQTNPPLKIEIDLVGIREAEVLASYKGYPQQLTLFGSSKQSLLSLVIPEEHFVQKAKELHSDLLQLCHIYYVWNPSFTRVSVGATHPALLPNALFRLQGKGEHYEEIHLQRVNHEATLWILPNIANQIILHTHSPFWLSLQFPTISRVNREGHTLHLSEEPKVFHRRRHHGRSQKKRREDTEKIATTISIPHYFPKAPSLHINEISYEVKTNESNACLQATLSIFDPPMQEINEQTLVNACCEVAIAENALTSEQNFFLGDHLHVGPIVLNLGNLSDALKIILAGEKWGIPTLRALKMKRMLAQKKKYDKLFGVFVANDTSNAYQNRTRRMASLTSSSAKLEAPFSWLFHLVRKYIPSFKEKIPHSEKRESRASFSSLGA